MLLAPPCSCELIRPLDRSARHVSPTPRATDLPLTRILQIVGAFFAWLNDWHGRRLAIFIGCLGVCLGGAVTATSPSLAGLVVGRFILSVCSTIATTATPMLLVEIAPPQYRGSVSGFYNTIYYVGSIISSVSVYVSPSLLDPSTSRGRMLTASARRRP